MSLFSLTEPLCTTCAGLAFDYCRCCNKYFCSNCLIDHRIAIKAQFNNIIKEHRQLQDHYRHAVTVEQHRLFSEIDQWELAAISKIRLVATEARNELQNILKETIKRTNTWLNELNDRLCMVNQNQDYSEKGNIHLENVFAKSIFILMTS